jgi:hypothetical protein
MPDARCGLQGSESEGARDGFVAPSVPPHARAITDQAMATALAAWRLACEEIEQGKEGAGYHAASDRWTLCECVLCATAIWANGPSRGVEGR